MASHFSLVAVSVLHLVAVLGYAAFLARGAAPLLIWANRVLGLAVTAQALIIFIELSQGISRSAVHYALMGISTLIGFAFLGLVARRQNLAAVGVFIAPVVLLLFVGSAAPSISTLGPLRWTLLPAHIIVNALGVTFFALAFAVAVAYLIQDLLLRKKRVVGLLQRFPSLDVLDSIGMRLVVAGFPLLTLGILSGIFWWIKSDTAATPAATFAIAAWICFGGVLLLRYAYGWRGRRAAIGTVMGFLFSMMVLAGYFFRATGGVL